MSFGVSPSESMLLLLVIVIMVIAGWAALASRRFVVRWQRRQQWSRARNAEQLAPQLLAERGFEVTGSQVEATYRLVVDGESRDVSLRADYVATRGGRKYVAEVKSGKFAPSLGTAATRRQLLEYLVAFRVDGVLLVDGELQQVHEVEFPISKRSIDNVSSGRFWLHAGALGIAVALVWVLLIR